MSKYDKASLVHIPSGYKSGTLYNVLPNNADGDFDFTRASTATRVDENGLIETTVADQARLNYDPANPQDPHLLLEPTRTNLITRSYEFGTIWAKGGSTTVTTDFSSAPDGTNTASRLQMPSGFGTYLSIAASMSSGTSYSLTFYIKNNGGQALDFGVWQTSSGGTKTDSLLVTPTDEWVRYELNFTADSNSNYVFIDNNNNSNSVDCLIWGAQLEAGSYPTSYIKTQGAAVTRSADVCNGAGTANDFNDSEGVLYANIAFTKEPVSGFVTISDGTDDERITIYRVGSLFPNKIQGQIREGNTARVSFGFDTNFVDLYNKIAIKYKANDFAFWVNGFEIDSNTSNTLIPDNLNNLEFAEGDGGNPFNGKTKEVIVFREALSDTELETLTSYKSFNEMATEQLYTIQ